MKLLAFGINGKFRQNNEIYKETVVVQVVVYFFLCKGRMIDDTLICIKNITSQLGVSMKINIR